MCSVSQSRKLMIVIMSLVILMGGLYFLYIKFIPEKVIMKQNIAIDGVYLPKATSIEGFNLTDNVGKPFTQDNLKGKWTLLLFGFTHCGYVCPTTLAELNHMYQLLEKSSPKNELPQVVFVSVDPQRDSVEKMNKYVKSFNPNFIGARGDLKETEKLENQLNITAIKVHSANQSDDEEEDYAVNHSAEILVFNPNGELQAFLAYPHKADQLVKDYNLILKNT